MIIKIGSRNSKLALIQTNIIIQKIKLHYPNVQCIVIPITTTGDIITNKPLYEIGGKALFLKELETALLEGVIDIAVHSLKDVPAKLHDDLVLSAFFTTEVANDALVCVIAKSIHELPRNAVVGTSSVRRKVILQNTRDDIRIVDIRGNVDTRINKLMQGNVDALILAAAGINRLGLFNHSYCSILSVQEMLPACCQGVIGTEIRKNDEVMRELCRTISDHKIDKLIEIQRAFLEYLDADCDVPIAAHVAFTDEDNTNIMAKFMLGDIHSGAIKFHEDVTHISRAREVGIDAAKYLMR